jgi:hypothetical protein
VNQREIEIDPKFYNTTAIDCDAGENPEQRV